MQIVMTDSEGAKKLKENESKLGHWIEGSVEEPKVKKGQSQMITIRNANGLNLKTFNAKYRGYDKEKLVHYFEMTE